MTAPRTILYTGKGGVGKTSVAAATARLCAARGMRTVVLSTDPAHSLSDSLETPLGPDPTPVAERLWGQEVQAQREMEANWGRVQAWLAGLLADRGVMDIAAEELTVPPGMDELFSLLQIKHHHESGEFDVVIVDCAPTGETLRLLSFPEIAQWWLERVFPVERKMVAAARPLAKTFLDVDLPDQDVFAEVNRLVRNLVAMNAILRDRERASIRLVMNADRMVVNEAQRTFTYLNLYGYLTDAVVVNRLFPEEVGSGYFGEWRRRQTERLAEIEQGFAPVPVLRARYFDEEVVGHAMLDRLGEELFGDGRPGGAVPYGAHPRGRAGRGRPHDDADPGAVRGPLADLAEEGRLRARRRGGPREADDHPPARPRPPQPVRGQARGRLARGELLGRGIIPVVANGVAAPAVERGRQAYADRAWRDAYEALSNADREEALAAEDLGLLSISAYMLGRHEDFYRALERAHQAFLDQGEGLRAAYCAFWVGINLMQEGEMGRAGGWLGRARRLVDREGGDCVEQGYLLIPRMFELEASGDLDGAIATAVEAAGDRRAVRRPGPGRARRPPPGPPHGDPRSGQGGPGAPGRGDAVGHHRASFRRSRAGSSTAASSSAARRRTSSGAPRSGPRRSPSGARSSPT